MKTTDSSREEIIAGNPLLEYAQKHGWQLKHVGPNFICLCPLHEETTPSFAINPGKNLWKCFGCDTGGSVIDLHAELRGLSIGEAMRELSPGGGPEGSSSNRENGKAANLNKAEAEEKARQRARWPHFETPAQAEIQAIAEFRVLSAEGISLAAQRRLLFCYDSNEGRAWVVTDSERINAQARLLSGKRWANDAKAKTLPGSVASWPIGLPESASFPAIALVEGGPDMLAAFHLAWCASREDRISPVTVLGAGNSLPQGALRHFAGKRVRIFEHDDEPGRTASRKWAPYLSRAGAEVDGFSFSGLARFDGAPVKDLNDFACIDPDEWEAKWDIIEGAFAFAPETAKEASSNGSNAEQRAA
jgi:CHC2 zinc finger